MYHRSQALLESFLREGVDTLFGYPGGAIIPVYDALFDYRDRLRHILVRHDAEQEHELLPRKAVPQALHGGPHSVGVWLPSSKKTGECRSSSNRPGQRTCSRPARMALSGMFQPRLRSTRRP